MRREERLDDVQEALRLAINGALNNVWTALPGVVVSVNLEAQTVAVQPTVQGTITDKEGNVSDINLPVLPDVPIVWPRAGGFALTFPVKPEDEVLVVFASRCIDAWWQEGTVSPAMEARTHDLSDGFAILAPTSQPKRLVNVSAENVQLRNEAGSSVIEIDAAGNIALRTDGTLRITAGQIVVEGPVTQSGGSVVLDDGVDHVGHVHGGVTTGSGTTSGPQ